MGRKWWLVVFAGVCIVVAVVVSWPRDDEATVRVESADQQGICVRNLDDARGYLSNGPLAMYQRHGFGLYRVELKSTGEAIGLCGLIKRDTLEHVDIGYALFPAYWGQGYAAEATAATRDYARDTLQLPRLLAICSPDNAPSIGLLQRLGLAYEGAREFTPGVPSVVYGMDF